LFLSFKTKDDIEKEILGNAMKKLLYIPLLFACKPTIGVTEKVEIPTLEEVNEASSQPSSEPSSQPSSEPSSQPSSEPSSQPSSEPSSQPSSEPSSQPSSEPSSTYDPCAEVQTEYWTAGLPYTAGCSWGQGGNLEEEEGLYRARAEQEDVYTPPSGYQICDIRFDFESDSGNGVSGIWGYDDDFILTLNDRVLVASHASMVSGMTPVSNSYIYDWGAVKNTQQNFEVDYFYFGSVSEFYAPAPPGVGVSYMYVGSNALDPHRLHAISENEIRMMMVTFGDNETYDCFNNGFYTNIEVDIGQQ
jgi:hypothetical protein